MVADVMAQSSPLDVELWASHFLGSMWEGRTDLPPDEADDYALVYGRPLVEAVAAAGGPGALTAIAAVDDGNLAGIARGLADGLPRLESEPSWLSCVGTASITSAATMRDDVFDDGVTTFLEARHATGDTHAVGVYINNNLGMMATDILLTDSLERVAEVIRGIPGEDADVTLVPLEPGEAAAQIAHAILLTEMSLDPPVTEDYAALRALAALRADEVAEFVSVSGRGEMPRAERDALCDEFLSAAEGRGFAPDGDEAFAASLAIDFCADYVDGRPLRWSPQVVEFFMASWIPRKVLADAGLYAALPAGLDAWVRFAGRKRGLPQWAIETTREAIPQWRDEMTRAGSDPASVGPAKQFLTAAQEAGVDLSDQEALMTFMAGWNARSTAA